MTIFSALLLSATLATAPPADPHYTVRATLDAETHALDGTWTLRYTNTTDRPVRHLWLRLAPNAYRDARTPYGRYLAERGTALDKHAPGGIDGFAFRAEGEALRTKSHTEYADLLCVTLPRPLPAGEAMEVTTPFRTQLPAEVGGVGYAADGYHVDHWFPQLAPAGKAAVPFMGSAHTPTTIGVHDVLLMLPTGLTPAASAPVAETTTAADGLQQTLRFATVRTPDFAWTAAPRREVREVPVSLPNNRTVTLQIVGALGESDGNTLAVAGERALRTLSEWYGNYPYDQLTITDHPLGAERGGVHPALIVLGEYHNAFARERALIRGLADQWWSRAEDPWLRLGAAADAERRYVALHYPDKTAADGLDPVAGRLVGGGEQPFARLAEHAYLLSHRTGRDQPLDLPVAAYDRWGRYSLLEQKSALLLSFARDYFGAAPYDALVQEMLLDETLNAGSLRVRLEEAGGESWAWLFRDLVTTTAPYDYAVKGLTEQKDGGKVYVENVGSVEAPVAVSALRGGEVVETRWYPGFKGVKALPFPEGDWDEITLDGEQVTPDVRRHNDWIDVVTQRKVEAIRVTLLPRFDDARRTQVSVTPVVGYNAADRLMIGFALTGPVLPPRRLNFLVMPMVGSSLGGLTGSYHVNYHLPANERWSRAVASFKSDVYAGFEKFDPSLNLELPTTSTARTRSLRVRATHVRIRVQELPDYLPEQAVVGNSRQTYTVLSAAYRNDYRTALRRAGTRVEARHQMGNFTKLTGEATWGHRHSAKGWVELRAFAGAFVQATNVRNNFRMGVSGGTDYLMDEIFLDRPGLTNSLAAFRRQRHDGQGGFRAFTDAHTQQWLTTATAAVDLPNLPLRAWADAGYVPEVGVLTGVGVDLRLVPGVLTVHLPLAGSSYAQRVPRRAEELSEQLRFTLHLHELAPHRLMRAWMGK
ncbi:MAG: hypothetical protein WBA12_11090 [Catalinimonas sp.]